MHQLTLSAGLTKYYFYRPQTKFAKVMLLHLSVSHSVHRGVSRPRPRGVYTACTEADTPPHSRRLLLWAVRILLECILVDDFYHLQQSWGKVMFLQASVILLMGVCVCTPPPSRHTSPPPRSRPPWEQTHPPPEQTPPPQSRACYEIRSTRGRYASYWNAIFFLQKLTR